MTAPTGLRARTWLPRSIVLRQLEWNHPEWWVGPLVGLAWVVLVATAAVKALDGPSAAGQPLSVWFVCPIVAGDAASSGMGPLVVDLVSRTLMVVAMMGWLLVPTLHHVGLTGTWARRRRGPALVLAAYVAVWVAVTTGLDVLVGTTAATMGPVIAAALAIAAPA